MRVLGTTGNILEFSKAEYKSLGQETQLYDFKKSPCCSVPHFLNWKNECIEYDGPFPFQQAVIPRTA